LSRRKNCSIALANWPRCCGEQSLVASSYQTLADRHARAQLDTQMETAIRENAGIRESADSAKGSRRFWKTPNRVTADERQRLDDR